MRWPVRAVVVVGDSMLPTLRDGDEVLVWLGRSGPRIRPGDVVLARFRALPDTLVVKRADHPVDGGWWLTGDNTVGYDSRRYGPADVLGRVTLRIHPGRPIRVTRRQAS